MDNWDLEYIKEELQLSLATNVYISYNLPDTIIYKKESSATPSKEKYQFSFHIESDYKCLELKIKDFNITYKLKNDITYMHNEGRYYSYVEEFEIADKSYRTEMRSCLRERTRPIFDFLFETGFNSKTDIEDFMFFRTQNLHFTRPSQKEIEAELKKKEEEEKSLQLSKYILITDDSMSIDSSDIKRFQALNRCSDIVVTLGTEELKETDETIGYIEFIPTTFNDSIKVAFLLCESDKFAENRGLTNTINRILRFMLPLHEILCKYFEINTETVLSIARGETAGPLIIKRIIPLDNGTEISKGILQLSDLADALCTEPVDMVVISCRDNIWNLSFSDDRLLRIDSQGQKEHSLNVIKHELLNHGYFIHENAFTKYIKKADFSTNLYFKKDRNA